jgi:hypothetical protein
MQGEQKPKEQKIARPIREKTAEAVMSARNVMSGVQHTGMRGEGRNDK